MRNLIDRDELIKDYCAKCKEFHHMNDGIGDGCEDCRTIEVIKEQPSVTVDEKQKSYWISGGTYNYNGLFITKYKCGNCGFEKEFATHIPAQYCQRCGCSMMRIMRIDGGIDVYEKE